MAERVRIVDIAEELGVSTATVSNVIHGKTKKISDRTVKRVQELLEERQYIPSMAGILLSQNDSRIVGVVVNDHIKYEGRVLEDAFIAASLNALLSELSRTGHFMMVKVTTEWNEIVRFASMWNMDGLVLIGFCERDYERLREKMHIPFVVYDGFFQENPRICNLIVDSFEGGRQVGTYLYRMGHRRILCVSDNDICMDKDRMDGCLTGMRECAQTAGGSVPDRNQNGTEGEVRRRCLEGDDIRRQDGRVDWLRIPMNKQERMRFYEEHMSLFRQYTAVFAMSDVYAVELLYFLQKKGMAVPEDISVVGFDNALLSGNCHPALTTVGQDARERAVLAVEALREFRQGQCTCPVWKLSVQLVLRESVREVRDDEQREA